MDRSRALDSEEMEKFLTSLGDYQPAFPDELVQHYLSRSGFQTDDVRLIRLIALAAQKFVADVANDAIASSRLRSTASAGGARSKAAARDPKLSLTVDDLERALREYGVNLRKPPYFADSVSAGVPEPQPSQDKTPVEKAGASGKPAAGSGGGGGGSGGASAAAGGASAAAGGAGGSQEKKASASGSGGAGGAAASAAGDSAGAVSGQKPPTK